MRIVCTRVNQGSPPFDKVIPAFINELLYAIRFPMPCGPSCTFRKCPTPCPVPCLSSNQFGFNRPKTKQTYSLTNFTSIYLQSFKHLILTKTVLPQCTTS